MYPNQNMYNGFMPRQVAYPQNGYPQGYGGAYPPPYMAAQNGQAMPPQEPPISDVRFLTKDEMRAFIVMPNTKVLLIDKDSGIACIKKADAMGQSEAKLYVFAEENAKKEETPKESAPAEEPEYIKEIKELRARVEKLESKGGKAKGDTAANG